MTTSGSVNIPPSFRLVDIGEKAFKKLTIDNPRALSPEGFFRTSFLTALDAWRPAIPGSSNHAGIWSVARPLGR